MSLEAQPSQPSPSPSPPPGKTGPASPADPEDEVIVVEKLSVRYGKGAAAFEAVKGLSFHVNRGECVGFVGLNGAGKSSTIKALMGFLRPAAGSIRVNGFDAGDPRAREGIGYLPEVSQYYPYLKARELLELYGGLSGMSRDDLKARIPVILREVGLDGKGEQFLGKFSKGMQQRTGIAQALIADPDLLILDELNSGLDPLGRHDLRQTVTRLQSEGKTLFFSSHELNEIHTICDRVLVIHQGRLIATDTPENLSVRTGGNLEEGFIELIRNA